MLKRQKRKSISRSGITLNGVLISVLNRWIERLRIVGLDRQRERRAAQHLDDPMSPPSVPESFVAPGAKRRRGPPTTDNLSTVTGRVGADEEGLLRRKKGGRGSSGRESMELESES